MNFSKRFFAILLALILLISAIPMSGAAKGDIILGIARVNASTLHLRSEADTDAKSLAKASRGEVVVVLSKEGDWYKVNYNLSVGYMHADYLQVSKTADVELGYGTVNGSNVNLRKGPSTSRTTVARGNSGDKAYIIGVNNGWYKVIFESKICYIRSDFLNLTEVPYENSASSNSPKFFKNGKSTGVEPSASALGGSASSSSTSTQPTEAATSSSSSAATFSSDGKMYGIGFVSASNLRLRSAASTSASTLATAPKGDVVVIISKSGDWCKVVYNLKVGYMHSDYLSISTSENAELGYGKVNGSRVNLRSGPSTSYNAVSVASNGDKAYILGINDGWYKIIYGEKICYIRSDYLDLTEIPYENKASSNTPKFFRGGKSTGVTPSASALNGTTGSSTSSGSTSSTESSSSTGDKIVATAKKYLGVPYVWGGTTPSGFDCSGFVYYVLRSNGFNVSRTQTAMYSQGTPVDKSDLQPGDVVFFQNTYKAGLSHVGIYVGGGQFIHAPQTGKVVSYADLNSTYYVSHYYGAVRFG